MMTNEKWDYVINERKGSALLLITYFIPSVLFSVLAADQFVMKPGKSVIIGILFAVIAVISIRSLIMTCIKFFCCRICIGKRGFYFRSGISAGKYYRYTDIVSCSTNTNSYSRKGHSFCEYWFIFRDKNGNKMKYQYNKSLYAHEINELRHRIDAAHVTE